MIVDLDRFLAAEEPYWKELEDALDALDRDAQRGFSLEEAKRFHYLYERACSDLARLSELPSAPVVRQRLEPLVAHAYAEIHETRGRAHRFAPLHWFLVTFPATFRRHINAFGLVAAITLAGCLFGALALYADDDAKRTLLPFAHLQGDPSDRVAYEENAEEDRMRGGKTSFSAFLMTHNTRVSIFSLGLGITGGAGTAILLFYNGVILGAVGFDYINAGEARFLFGWLLPHGAIEIPAFMIAAQAGFVLGLALIGRGSALSLRTRLRAVSSDSVTLIGGVALMLVWAGIIEAFLSQNHEPTLPYWLKIAFGLTELVLLTAFLALSGRGQTREQNQAPRQEVT